MLGKLGLDWVLIDGEHGSLSPESMELIIMAAEASGLTPIVRPASSTPEAILQALDRGALGVQAPHVNTAGEARRVVQAARYHPLGSRGLAAGTRAGNYGFGLSLSDHAQQANRETLVCIQLEEVEALRNLDEIVQVEGVDVFFIGPSDLSQSMGYPGPDRCARGAGRDEARVCGDCLGRQAGRVGGECAGGQALPGPGMFVRLYASHAAAGRRRHRVYARGWEMSLDFLQMTQRSPLRATTGFFGRRFTQMDADLKLSSA